MESIFHERFFALSQERKLFQLQVINQKRKKNRVKSTTCSRAQDTLLKQLIRNESTGLVRNITKCLTIKLITRALFFCETTWYLKFKFK